MRGRDSAAFSISCCAAPETDSRLFFMASNGRKSTCLERQIAPIGLYQFFRNARKLHSRSRRTIRKLFLMNIRTRRRGNIKVTPREFFTTGNTEEAVACAIIDHED